MTSKTPKIILGCIPIIIGIVLTIAGFSFVTTICINIEDKTCSTTIAAVLLPIAYMILGLFSIGIGGRMIYKTYNQISQ
jgi:hypothetical protein